MSKRTLFRFAKCSLALAALCLLLWPKSALASPVTYTYTGNPFTSFSGLSCPSDCRITGSFTLSAPLGDNFSGTIVLTSFSFTDGSFTLSTGGAGVSEQFSVTTNGSGAIVQWILLLSNCRIGGACTEVLSSAGGNGPGSIPNEDFVETKSSQSLNFQFLAVNSAPGSWSASTGGTVTPEPSSLLLLGTGFLGLGPFIRRRFTKP